MASKKKGMRRRAKVAKGKTEVDKANIKAMANSMRVQLLTILNERVNSTTGLARELGVEPAEIAYDIAVLRKMGRIEVVDEKKRRGAVEVFYKAVARAHLDELEWPTIPDPVKGGMRASLLQTIMDDAIAAIDEEAYDSLPNAHMSWTPLIVDREGWEELTEILRVALKGVIKVSESSAKRLTKKDEAGISCTVSMLGYRSAVEDRKVGPPVMPKELKSPTASKKQKVGGSRSNAKKSGVKSKTTKATKRKGPRS
jgi:DNA-binding transcriptional ArsR family regulator